MAKGKYVVGMALALGIAGCSTPTRSVYVTEDAQVAYRSSHGRVTRIERIEERGGTSGAGAVLGGILGGVVGHQIGSGSGRDAATAVGAIGGAVIGNEVERGQTAPYTYYRVTVRMGDGDSQVFKVASIGGLRVGDRVRVEGGQLYYD